MKKVSAFLAISLAALSLGRAAVLSSIPGPDDQGGMIMPMVTLSGNTLSLMFMPPSNPPDLKSLDGWVSGATFDPDSAWYAQLDPVNGAGDLFNNQYGFTYMVAEGSPALPAGKALGIRLTDVSSPLLQSWNYSMGLNLFDEIFMNIGDQVLWNGSMWHNYFTLPADAAPGIYTAQFEVFVANGSFTAGTGFADYSQAARTATQDTNYNSVLINYSWEVIPEPSTYLLLFGGLVVMGFTYWRKRQQA